MKKIIEKKLVAHLDDTKLDTLRMLGSTATRKELSKIWDTDISDLSHYHGLFFNKNLKNMTDTVSFMTLSFSQHGYMMSPDEMIDIEEAKKQIEIDLEIINRESQWSEEESIYFDEWWPTPHYNKKTKALEFGLSLKDYHNKVFNRTLNRIILTRYGHILLNYSLSEQDILDKAPLEFYQKKLDEVEKVINISTGYGYKDINEDEDFPSKFRMINLILSSEIF